MTKFNHTSFEKKWQNEWDKAGIYNVNPDSVLPKCYVLDMFPYPSGSSMHVGHPRGYVATDVYSRFKRMSGYNVLHPMGWDAFGLPAEETALANKEYPAATVQRNIKTFKRQLGRLGIGYDWTREINTTDQSYYKHTQRIFLEFFRMGLAYNKMSTVNWCPELGTVLANEDIIDGKSERGGHLVIQQPMRQWILAITKYADRLVNDLNSLPEWPEKVKNAQRNWIGACEGHVINFKTNIGSVISVFTDVVERVKEAAFIAIAPDSSMISDLVMQAHNIADLKEYIELSKHKTSLDRQIAKTKTAIIMQGITAINPISGDLMPIIISDDILSSYANGAVICAPSHNKRDLELAHIIGFSSEFDLGDGKPLGSEQFSEIDMSATRKLIASSIEAKESKQYKIQDWVFSRQRFWGEPFPIIWIEGRDNYNKFSLGIVSEWLPKEPVMYEENGVQHFAVPIIPQHLDSAQLPIVKSYEPTGTLQGPLANIKEWANVFINPQTGAVHENSNDNLELIPGYRETNTMPQWAGSSWYWLRYIDSNNVSEPFSKSTAKSWLPVDVYAGADHAVAHLIYARFWHKVLFDAGMVECIEPFKRLEFLGYILASDGSKISKRSGNSKSPDAIIDKVGADAFRLYEMFIGPFEKAAPWIDSNLNGTSRFLDGVWKFANRVIEEDNDLTDANAISSLHRTIDKVSKDIESFKFNTAVSCMMSFLKECSELKFTCNDLGQFIKILAPFAPHICEEIWSHLKNNSSIHITNWPIADISLISDNASKLPIFLNGKKFIEISVTKEITEKELKMLVLNNPKIQSYISDQMYIKKFIYQPGRILNIVAEIS